MPWYRTDDGQGVMHILMCRGKRGAQPAACRAPRSEGDNPEHGDQCGRVGGKLCDAPVGAGTCDMPLCSTHATHVEGQNLDYCPRHKHLATQERTSS